MSSTAKARLRRPSRAMMLAVNAAIDRKDKEVARLIKEHDLDAAELERRLLLRDGKRYDLSSPRRRSRESTTTRSQPGKHEGRSRSLAPLLDVAVDGRTAVARLFRLIEYADKIKARAQQELERRPPEEIETAKKAIDEAALGWLGKAKR